jgi:Domain of unknown function (DUF4398)
MNHIMMLGIVLAAAGCASYPAPTERIASSMAAVRGAQELGAAQVPQAALAMKLAQEEVAKAKVMMDGGDNESADFMAQRATNDAELAIALTRENTSRLRAGQAAQKAQTAANPNP